MRLAFLVLLGEALLAALRVIWAVALATIRVSLYAVILLTCLVLVLAAWLLRLTGWKDTT